MFASRRDLLRLSALATSALALPTLADSGRPEPMRLLILGGTGFIGPHQVRYAPTRGHHVTIFNRGRQKEARPGPVEELLGDRDGDLKALEGRDWDVCIDNPTSLPIWVRDAAHVLKGHIGRYIFISTISVYAATNKPADETAPLVAYKGDDPMAETIESLNANPRLYGPLKALSETEARTAIPVQYAAHVICELSANGSMQIRHLVKMGLAQARAPDLGGKAQPPQYRAVIRSSVSWVTSPVIDSRTTYLLLTSL